MTPTVPNGEPTELIAADAWQWDKHLSDYPPSDGYTLKYALQGPAVLAADITAATSAEGDYFEVRHAANAHGNLVQGHYTLIGWVELAGARVKTVYEAAVHVRVHNTSTAQVSQDEQELTKLDAAILTLETSPHASVEINGRTITYADREEIYRRRGEVRARVAAARRGGRFQRREVHFRRA